LSPHSKKMIIQKVLSMLFEPCLFCLFFVVCRSDISHQYTIWVFKNLPILSYHCVALKVAVCASSSIKIASKVAMSAVILSCQCVLYEENCVLLSRLSRLARLCLSLKLCLLRPWRGKQIKRLQCWTTRSPLPRIRFRIFFGHHQVWSSWVRFVEAQRTYCSHSEKCYIS
jgi:hypothetical protein